MKKVFILSIAVFALPINFVSAELIRGIDIEFVAIGNPGNAGDTRDAGYSNPYDCGSVDYEYQIGKYEITNTQWDTFTGIAGLPTGSDEGYAHSSTYYSSGPQHPTNMISWYEAAQFCNYLTSGDKSKGVYQFNGNNLDPSSFIKVDRNTAQATYGTIYFLPTEDEWYKAAYYKPDDSGYSRYTNGLDTIPTADNGWNYYGGAYSSPWDVGNGSMEQNGTYDMMGNVWEWTETLSDDARVVRGGPAHRTNTVLSSSYRDRYGPNREYDVDGAGIGFRVASIPEPATLLLLGIGAVMMNRRHFKTHHIRKEM